MVYLAVVLKKKKSKKKIKIIEIRKHFNWENFKHRMAAAGNGLFFPLFRGSVEFPQLNMICERYL